MQRLQQQQRRAAASLTTSSSCRCSSSSSVPHRQQRQRRLAVVTTATPAPADATTAAPAPAPASANVNGAGRKVSIVQLGCPKNVVDGEVMLGDLRRAGFDVVDDPAAADAVVVNTCAFVEDAKAESLEAIVAAARLGEADSRRREVVVTGCLAQRYGAELAGDLPEAGLIVGFERYGGLPAALAERLDAAGVVAGSSSSSNGGGAAMCPVPTEAAAVVEPRSSTSSSSSRVQVGGATVPFRSEAERHRLTPPHTAYLRVAEGCDQGCTFCAIPGFRGRFRSKPWGAVLDEARALVAGGVRELCLIAEDTNQYGMDFKQRDARRLPELLRALTAIDGLAWVRLLYCYPSFWSEALIDELATNPKVCKCVDIPLQHGANIVLLAMNRPPAAHTNALLDKLRARVPDLALRTTFISGFPGERARDHKELVDFVRSRRFERGGVFAYSQEDGTPAADLPDQIPPRVRERRRDELTQVMQQNSEAFARSLVGRELDVLVDGVNGEGWLYGRTQYDAPDNIDPLVWLADAPATSAAGPLEVGQLRRCRVTGVSLFDLEAVPLD